MGIIPILEWKTEALKALESAIANKEAALI